VRLLSNEASTPTTRLIRIALDGTAFPYRAGQAASIGRHGEPVTPYSIASAPSDSEREGYLEFLIKVDGSNRFGAQVTAIEPGTRVQVTPAFGRFGIPADADGRPLLFIAGGTGIAPLRSMIREQLHHDPEARMALVYSARRPGEFAFVDEFRAMADAGRLNLTLTLTGNAEDWRHARGRAGDQHFAELLIPESVCFICGPPAMCTDIPQALTRLGIPRERILTEDW
jgi:ferredoxin-NADP reductase